MHLLLLLLTLLPGASLQEAEADGDLARTAPLRVYLITMDQGDEVWERFGHNALMVRNEATGEEVAWNWGLFNFEDVDFIPRFLRGTMRYSMGGMDPGWMVESYAASNRSVYANEVHLTPAQAAELDEFVRWNAREENRHYIYDYFRDNCSTRIRDVLDLVLEGRLQERFHDRLTPESYRWHARRLVRETTWIDQGLSFLLGTRGDRPVTEWEAMFVPMILLELLEDTEVSLADGTSRPLLGPRQTLFLADRPLAPAGPPPLSPLFPLLGILGGGLLVLLAWLGAGGSGPRREAGSAAGGAAEGSTPRFGRPLRGAWPAFGVLAGGWILLSGLLGWLLVLAWFTDHVFIQWNVNLLYFSPLLPIAGLLLLLTVPRRWGPGGALGRWAALAALVVAVGSLAGLALQATGLVVQGNAEVVAVGVPVNLGLCLGVIRLHLSSRARTSGREGTSG